MLSARKTSFHRYSVGYPSGFGGLPAPPSRPAPALPWLKGKKTVLSFASRVVIHASARSTQKNASTRLLKRKQGSRGSRSFFHCSIAFFALWPVNWFFSSKANTGIPFTASTMSTLLWPAAE